MSSRLDCIQDWTPLADAAQFCVQDLATLCQVSPRQLERHFIQAFSQSPREWMRQHRMQRAAVMLAQGQRPKEVAYTLGFKNIPHFYREFKLFNHKPPLAFALMARLQAHAKAQAGKDVAPGKECRKKRMFGD